MKNNNENILNLNNKQIGKLTHSYIMWSVFLAYEQISENFLLVLPNLSLAQYYYDELSSMIGNDKILFYPSDGILTTLMAMGSNEFGTERLNTLFTLTESNDKYIIIATIDAALKHQLTPTDYKNSFKFINVGEEYQIEYLTKLLSYNGYLHNHIVEKPGEFSFRGSILDYYPKDQSNPIRIEFFDNLIEEIRIFDVESQRTLLTVDNAVIKPLTELFYHDELLEKAIKKINDYIKDKELSSEESKRIKEDINDLTLRRKLDHKALYTNFFTDEPTTILDFLKGRIIFIEPSLIDININNFPEELLIYQEKMGGETLSRLPLLYPYEKFINSVNKFLSINKLTDGYNANVEPVSISKANFKQVLEILRPYKQYQYYLVGRNINKLIEDETNYEILNNFTIIKNHIPESFIDHNNHRIYLDANLFSEDKFKSPIRYRSVINQAVKIRTVEELKQNDYVIHYDFGIGKYLGIKTLTMQNQKRDYLELLYDNEEKMYVPIEHIDLVLKYRSYDGSDVRLSKLGSKKWSRTKRDIKKRIKEMSDQLLKIYSIRAEANGFNFQTFPDSEQELVDDFMFKETNDQQKAIDEVLADMNSNCVMDRLIAGDVGFGKTEVAIRASYRAVLNAKQVMYLAPTTVLARQHYHTFRERLSKFGVNVELLNRFVSAKKQKEVIKNLKKGIVDIVIGTHRLLSSDIEYYDLGLLIIDEEQRFGVEHKEKIKAIKVNVDTLTLTATPIPRTLQMSLYGIKELSLIQTPPQNRYPVQTYVLPYDINIAKQAINRELARGGQVFYLYNRVSDMEKILLRLKREVPSARITTLHGQMNKEKIEREIIKFVNKEYDVLISTTIIETGIDIPNTNTLIIHDADTLGLAQLYQIRGRVGRSDKIAYAYLMYQPYKDLATTTVDKLKVIEEFTELGSGFKIALRDLKIRGAGDILGEEQSGFIETVGIDLYLKLLKEAMEGNDPELKREIKDANFAVKHIDPEYISSDESRLEIHQKMMKLTSVKQIYDLTDELIDRFGEPSEDLVLLMYERVYQNVAYKLNIEKLEIRPKIIKIIFNEEASNPDFLSFIGEKIANSKVFTLAFLNNRLELTYQKENNRKHFLYELLLSIEETFL